jgi:hypothetical protein
LTFLFSHTLYPVVSVLYSGVVTYLFLVGVDSGAGIRPCGGITTGDEYCCDPAPADNGNFACCSTASNLFTLPIPFVIATIPGGMFAATGSLQTSTSASGSTSTTAKAPTPTFSQEAPTTIARSGGYSTGDKIALGTGIGVGLPATVAAIWQLYLKLARGSTSHRSTRHR